MRFFTFNEVPGISQLSQGLEVDIYPILSDAEFNTFDNPLILNHGSANRAALLDHPNLLTQRSVADVYKPPRPKHRFEREREPESLGRIVVSKLAYSVSGLQEVAVHLDHRLQAEDVMRLVLEQVCEPTPTEVENIYSGLGIEIQQDRR